MAVLYVDADYSAPYYANEGLEIIWRDLNIFVPRSEMTLIQIVPTPIYNLDLDLFRKSLKELEASEEGMLFPDTHNHNLPVTVGGLTLARVVELINGYTVTFEDGQYAVNLIGANTNLGDVTNVNQVSVRPQNAAGLVDNSLNAGDFHDALDSYENKDNWKDAIDETGLHAGLDSYTNKADWKDTMDEASLHSALDSYTNKADWKATDVDLTPVLNAIAALNDLSLLDIEGSTVLAKEATLDAIATSIGNISVSTDLTPVLNAIAALNDVTPAEVRAAFDETEFKDSNTELQIHSWLDSYTNKANWKNTDAEITTAVWDRLL